MKVTFPNYLWPLFFFFFSLLLLSILEFIASHRKTNKAKRGTSREVQANMLNDKIKACKQSLRGTETVLQTAITSGASKLPNQLLLRGKGAHQQALPNDQLPGWLFQEPKTTSKIGNWPECREYYLGQGRSPTDLQKQSH